MSRPRKLTRIDENTVAYQRTDYFRHEAENEAEKNSSKTEAQEKVGLPVRDLRREFGQLSSGEESDSSDYCREDKMSSSDGRPKVTLGLGKVPGILSVKGEPKKTRKKYLCPMAKKVEVFIRHCLDSHTLRIDESGSMFVQDSRVDGADCFDVLTSMISKKSYEIGEGEVLAIIRRYGTPLIKKCLHPSKRRGIPKKSASQTLPPANPITESDKVDGKVTNITSSQLDGKIYVPSMELSNTQAIQVASQPATASHSETKKKKKGVKCGNQGRGWYCLS